MVIGQTSMCIRCLKRKAVQWTGHVLKGKRTLFAGWCNYCIKHEGFCGHYLEAMGVEKAE